jgi:hypothetical protein
MYISINLSVFYEIYLLIITLHMQSILKLQTFRNFASNKLTNALSIVLFLFKIMVR